MEVKINREIRDYTESMFFGLSLRQLIFSALAVAVAVLFAEALCRRGNRILDVRFGRGPFCRLGLLFLPRHDGGAVPLGVAALRGAGAEGTAF